MKGFTKLIVLVTFFFAICIPAVSAFTVSSLSIDPSGSLTQGTPVIVSYRIDFTGSGSETFPSTNELQMLTDLDNPAWAYTLILDGVETPQPTSTGRILSLSGWILSYPASVEESLKVTLDGTAPSVAQTTNKTMIKIQEVDNHNNVIDPVYEVKRVVINPDNPIDPVEDIPLVSRILPAAVSPGSQFSVKIIPNQSLLSDPGWKVLEYTPYGFSLVSTTAFYEKQYGLDHYLFIQNSSTPFTYVLRAPVTEGPYSFGGLYSDADKNSGQVGGNTTVNVGTAYLNYRNATTGKIEKVDARRAVKDNKKGLLSNQGAGSVLENYFLGL